ncbi:MAG: DbpA RNA binding domain-containing protein [Methylobacter sp.]
MDTGGMALMKGKVEQRRKPLLKALKADATDNAAAVTAPPGIKMVRYRLDVGSKHQVTSEELKKILIEESGVDKNNIKYINIQGDYTLVELPDEMPQDIFMHLKSVEINQRKLDIKRVKPRNKKRSNYGRRGRKRAAQSSGGSDQTSGSNQSEQI